MLDPAGTATPEAPLVVTDRLTGCDVLGAVASWSVNGSATDASHSAPRTRDRSIIRTSPKGDVSTIVPSSGSNAAAAACEPYHFFAGRWRSGSPVVTPTASSKDCAEAQGSVAGYPRTSSAATVMVGNRSGVIVFPRDTARWLVKLRGSHGPASSAGKPATRRLPGNWPGPGLRADPWRGHARRVPPRCRSGDSAAHLRSRAAQGRYGRPALTPSLLPLPAPCSNFLTS